MIHLATHSFFGSAECGTVLDALRSPSVPRRVAANPLLYSGLALAGANRRTGLGPVGEDGLLTAQEIAALDLSHAEWVVLSACETAGGQVQVGEGVMGLRRAFRLAGVGTLLMSLWAVEDESAREWMRELYSNRLQGFSTVESVARTNRAILERRRRGGLPTHPGSWGAFISVGNWR